MRRWAIEILCALVLAVPLLVLLLVLVALWMLLGLLVLVAWVMWEDMATRFAPTRSAAA